MMMFMYQRRRYDHNYLFVDPHFHPDNKPLIKIDEELVNKVAWQRPYVSKETIKCWVVTLRFFPIWIFGRIFMVFQINTLVSIFTANVK